jgi:hypothetical protein
MKFAHLADCHVGGWREPKLKELGNKAFSEAVALCIKEKVDFVLIAGDLFNTAIPAIDSLKMVVDKLRELRESSIPVYAIAGSHDFSPSGKTMIDVLESAGLLVNVGKEEAAEGKEGRIKLNFVTDRKTGAKIAGLLGKKGGLEKNLFAALEAPKFGEGKEFKIFMFHTTIDELKPKEMDMVDSISASMLPKGFDYYAGGHVHIVGNVNSASGSGKVVYPGPLFPNSFSELEKLGSGGFVIYDNGKIRQVKLELKPVVSILVDCNGKNPVAVEENARTALETAKLADAIVTLKLFGTLASGKTTDINLKSLFESALGKGAYLVLKNANQLASKDFAEIKVSSDSVEEIEQKIVAELAGKSKLFEAAAEKKLIEQLMLAFSVEKEEGEKQADFDDRLKRAISKLIEN